MLIRIPVLIKETVVVVRSGGSVEKDYVKEREYKHTFCLMWTNDIVLFVFNIVPMSHLQSRAVAPRIGVAKCAVLCVGVAQSRRSLVP